MEFEKKPEKTQTIRVNTELHRMAKQAAFDKKMQLQKWIEMIIKKECAKN